MDSLFPELWDKLSHCCSSTRMVLAFKTHKDWYAIKKKQKKKKTLQSLTMLIWNTTAKVLFRFFSSNTHVIVSGIYHHHHHHHVTPPARNSLTVSCHPSLLSVTPGRSSKLHPVSAQSCCIWVLAGHPAFARLFEGVHRSMFFYEFVLTSPAVPCMSGSSNLDSFFSDGAG